MTVLVPQSASSRATTAHVEYGKCEQSTTDIPTRPTSQSACLLFREDLDGYLVTSRYGENPAIFNCYFTRSHPSGPPLCVTCGRTIGEHPSSPRPLVTVTASSPVMATVQASAVGGLADGTSSAIPLPVNLCVGADYDEVTLKDSSAGFSAKMIVLGFVCVAFYGGFFYYLVGGLSQVIMIAISVLRTVPAAACNHRLLREGRWT